jgi:hypothetical protein
MIDVKQSKNTSSAKTTKTSLILKNINKALRSITQKIFALLDEEIYLNKNKT